MRRIRRWQSRPSLYSLIMRQTARLQVAAIALGLLLPPLAIVPLEMQQRIIDEAIPARDIAAVASLAAVFAGAMLASTAQVRAAQCEGQADWRRLPISRAALPDARPAARPAFCGATELWITKGRVPVRPAKRHNCGRSALTAATPFWFYGAVGAWETRATAQARASIAPPNSASASARRSGRSSGTRWPQSCQSSRRTSGMPALTRSTTSVSRKTRSQ